MAITATRAKFIAEFERLADAQPNHSALLYLGGEYNFAQLNQQVNRLAHQFQALGIGPNVRVAVCLERSPELLMVLMAVLKCGGAFAVLDANHPPARSQQMLAQLMPSLLVTQQSLSGLFVGVCESPIFLTDDWHRQAQDWPMDNVQVATADDDLAYIMYTSGSTGTPKGVMCSYGNLDFYLTQLSQTLFLAPQTRYLHSASFAFSSAIRQWWLPLIQGQTVVLATQAQVQDSAQLLGFIHSMDVSVLDTVASVWRSLLAQKSQPLQGTKVNVLVNSGGLLPSQLMVELRSQLAADGRMFNLYGQTETLGVTAFAITDDYQVQDEFVAVGPAYDGLSVQVCDAQDGVGELWVSGAGVSLGYWQNQGLTAQSYQTDEHGVRWYKTGDLVKAVDEANGSWSIQGRVDFQVKVHGMRVETGEIEAQLTQISALADAVVVGVKDLQDETRLVAYVVAKQLMNDRAEQLTLIADMRRELRKSLPEYMVPARFVILPEFPMTVNGKLARHELPEIDWHSSGRPYVAPNSEIETVLCRIIAQQLHKSKVGLLDHFIELGGNSLLAMQVMTEVNAQLGNSISLNHLFEFDTIGELAGFIATVQAQNSVPEESISEEGWL